MPRSPKSRSRSTGRILVIAAALAVLFAPAAFAQQFESSTTYQPPASGASGSRLTAADITGDQRLDLLTISYSELYIMPPGDPMGPPIGIEFTTHIRVLINDGAGNFTQSEVVLPNLSADQLSVGDVNGDGKADLLITGMGQNFVKILHGDGAGGFLDKLTMQSLPPWVVSGHLGDVTGDGKLDVVVIGPDAAEANPNKSAYTYVGDGSGNFAEPMISMAGYFAFATELVDMNGDGLRDLVTSNGSQDDTQHAIEIGINNGTGHFFTSASVWVPQGFLGMTVADYNKDGALDVIVGTSDGTVTIAYGDNKGNLAPSTMPTWGMTAFATGDINADGELDFVYTDANNNILVANAKSKGDVILSASGPSNSIVAATFDEGKIDIAVLHAPGYGHIMVALQKPPTPMVVTAGPPQTLTANAFGQASVTLNGTVDGPCVEVSWTEGATVLATTANATVNISLGVHTLTLNAISSDGFTTSATTTVSVELPILGGVAGPKGDQGATGATGATGANGADGAAGANGADGAVGPQGPAGATGAQGAKGDTGEQGATGATGANGADGAAGANGADGAVGPQGLPGLNGAIGETGAAGANGADGAVGPQGPTGAAGAIGQQGPAGTNGTNGAPGAPGLVQVPGSILLMMEGVSPPEGYAVVGTFVEERIDADGRGGKKPARMRIVMWRKL